MNNGLCVNTAIYFPVAFSIVRFSQNSCLLSSAWPVPHSKLYPYHDNIEDLEMIRPVLRDKIAADQRHECFRVVAEGPLQRRVFNDWGMVLRHVRTADNGEQPDFSAWQKRQIRFADLADDPQLCYAYISAHAQ